MSPLALSFPLFAQAAAPQGSGLMNVLFIGFMFAAMWFLIIAPQRKKQKEHAKMIAALDVGDEVLTAGGIYGKITAKREDRYVVSIGDGVKVELAKSFVQEVVKKKD
jgi:preprotein translocase subunit YajC